MGLYAQLPDTIRIVALGSFSGLIFFIYVLMMYLIPSRGSWLKYGLSFVMGGMFGNVIDKIALGRTIDFIPFNVGSLHTVFNVADVFLWIGMAIVFYMLIRHDHLIWHPDSSRRSYLILPKEQFKVALNFTLIVFCSSLILGIFTYTFFKVTLPHVSDEGSHVMLTFFITYSVLTLFFCILAFVTGVVLSHRSAGPLYAFQRYVDDLINGEDRKLSLRDGDNYRDLEVVADKLRDHLKK